MLWTALKPSPNESSLACFCVSRLKGATEREKENESESGVIKDSPDSPEPFNKKPRLTLEDLQPQEKSKGMSVVCGMNPAVLAAVSSGGGLFSPTMLQLHGRSERCYA